MMKFAAASCSHRLMSLGMLLLAAACSSPTPSNPSLDLGQDLTSTSPDLADPDLAAPDLMAPESAPTVTALAPAVGPVAAATAVTITGTGFTSATSVLFGTTAASSFTVDSSTSITAVAPAGAVGIVHVTVTNGAGTSATTMSDEFTYAPSVTSFAPPEAQFDGQADIVLTGTGFSGATAVAFGVTPATAFVVDSDTQITATAPIHSAEIVDVTVTVNSVTSPTSASTKFEFVDCSTYDMSVTCDVHVACVWLAQMCVPSTI